MKLRNVWFDVNAHETFSKRFSLFQGFEQRFVKDEKCSFLYLTTSKTKDSSSVPLFFNQIEIWTENESMFLSKEKIKV